MKKWIATLLTLLLCLSLLAACGKKTPLTEAEAQKVALEAANLTESQVSDIHTHIIDHNGAPCYQVHMTTESGDVTVVINATTGEVISNG